MLESGSDRLLVGREVGWEERREPVVGMSSAGNVNRGSL